MRCVTKYISKVYQSCFPEPCLLILSTAPCLRLRWHHTAPRIRNIYAMPPARGWIVSPLA